jgi:TetR/AcrR family transcriptional repressor of nem operon
MMSILNKGIKETLQLARTSRETASRRREEVVQAASRLFRERGVQGVSVPDLMAEAGMTHGGFYRHFESKDALEAEAYGRGLEQTAEYVWSLIEQKAGDGDAARWALFDNYLSARHRDDPGAGCATAALAVDAARKPTGNALRAAVGGGIERMVDILTGLSGVEEATARRTDALATFSTLVGALVLARATAGAPLSQEILEAARSSLGDQNAGHP